MKFILISLLLVTVEPTAVSWKQAIQNASESQLLAMLYRNYKKVKLITGFEEFRILARSSKANC